MIWIKAVAACLVLFTVVPESKGQGKNEEVTIIAPYIPTIGEAAKIPFRPEITPEETTPPSFQYEYVTRGVTTRLELDPVEPVRVSEGKQEELYRNFAKVGFGNYLTPYAEFMASNLQSEQYQFGARLKHHSSQTGVKGYEPEAFSHNLVSVFGRTFLKNHTLTADLGYQRDVYHFYGFPADSFPGIDLIEEDLKQRFQHISAGVDFSSKYTNDDKIGHRIGLEFHHYGDRFETREMQVSADAAIESNLPSNNRDFKHGFVLDVGFDYFNYKDSIRDYKPLFIEIRPVYRFGISQYRFEAGISINMLSEQQNGASNFTLEVFPQLRAEVIILDEQLKAYAEFTGDRIINSFRQLTGINPYITSTPVWRATDRQIRFGGGITGHAGRLNFLAEASYSYVNNQPFFITDTSLALDNKFLVTYDNLNILNVKAGLGYVVLNKVTARLTGNYYHNIPRNEEQAWQMPNFELLLDAAYRFGEKHLVKTSLLALGTRYAKTYDNAGLVVPEKMKGAFDWSAGYEYRINKMVAVGLDINNILNQQYQRWYHYPVQGILVMASAKVSF